MIRSLSAVACFLLALTSDLNAQAQLQPNTTGNAFYTVCTPQNPMYEMCVEYVTGYVDGLNLSNALLAHEGRAKMFCMPSSGTGVTGPVTGVQMVDMVRSYMQRYPQRRHELTTSLVIDTFKDAFPCR